MNPYRFLAFVCVLTIASIASSAAQGYYYNYPAYRRAQAQRAAANAYTTTTTQRPTRQLTDGYGQTYTSPRQQLQQQQLDAYRRTRANSGKSGVSKSDVENAKFAGAQNQERDANVYNDPNGEGKTAKHLYRKKLKVKRLLQQQQLLSNPCFPFGRDAESTRRANEATPPPSEQGRFLWDVNVYNVYPGPNVGVGGCGGYGGFGGGGFGGNFGVAGALAGGAGGILSDPVAAIYPPPTPFANFLSLFAPGILQNSLAVTRPIGGQVRPQLQSDLSEANDLQNDPAVDPNYGNNQLVNPVPVRRPNRVYYDSAGAPAVTPAQLVGGVATTVNGIIQQLTGNVQPVYPSYRRSQSYG